MRLNSVRSNKGWDALLTILVIAVFAISAFRFHIQEKVFAFVHAQPGSYGYFGFVFLGWGIWSTTVTAIIVGVLVSLKNYWKWVVFSICCVWLIWSIDMMLTEFANLNTQDLLEGLWTYFVLYIPFSMLVACCVFFIRKKISGDNYE